MKNYLLTVAVVSLLLPLGVTYAQNARPIKVAGWIPNWTKEVGINTAMTNISFFDEISPFAYEIGYTGKLIDRFKKNKSTWQALYLKAKKKKVPIIPTILWTDTHTMETILGNVNLRAAHVAKIVDLVQKNGFSGIDIDYEAKDPVIRIYFANFIESLGQKLHEKKHTLACTIEARTQDDIPDGWQGKKAMSWANDLTVLNDNCDEVRVMAYDEQSQAIGKQWNASSTLALYAPNASAGWVEKVIGYMLQYIRRDKLMLGIPTYGWQYTITQEGNDTHYKFYKSISYTNATTSIPVRDSSGELTYTYDDNGRKVFVSFPDVRTIEQGMSLARKYLLRGVSIFKIDGKEDPRMWLIRP